MGRRAAAATVCVLGVAAGLTMLASSGSTAPRPRVAGNLVFWDQERGFDTVAAQADVLTEVSPFWYYVEPDGRVVPYASSAGLSYEDTALVAFLRQRGILVIPTVANIRDGAWNGPAVSRIIGDPALAATNIAQLVELAVARSYDGIDLDYEDLAAGDRAAFSRFVRDLAFALHARGKLLTVNVYAKTSEPGTWDGPRAQDWAVIGAAADQVRVMTYEYHWATSGPGPIAPVGWVSDVLAFARTLIPVDKIMQGVPFYGYDWVGQSGRDVVWTEAMALAAQYSATVRWDAAAAAPWFEYLARKVNHTVWFENAQSVDAKLELAQAHGVGGVTLWRLGGEDPDNWIALRSRFGGVAPPPDTTPPTASMLFPLDGQIVDRRQRIQVLAVDNVRVSRVDIYVDGTLLASDASEPYVTYWNTRRVTPGSHVVTARVHDPSGNVGSAEVTVIKP